MDMNKYYKEIYYDLKLHGISANTFLMNRLSGKENDNELHRKLFQPIPWYQSLYYTLLSPFWKLRDLKFSVKMWLQKHIRGYSDLDVWNPTHSIHSNAYVLFDAFLKSKRYGYQFFTDEALETGIINHEVQPVSFEEDDWEEREKYWVDRYEYVISEIRWAFWFSGYEYRDCADEWAWIRHHNGMKWFANVGLSIWD